MNNNNDFYSHIDWFSWLSRFSTARGSSDESSHICIMWLKVFLVRYEKYGTLSMYVCMYVYIYSLKQDTFMNENNVNGWTN